MLFFQRYTILLSRPKVAHFSTLARGPIAGLPKKVVAERPREGDPMFKDVYRKFQLRVHPDLFTEYSDLQTVNAASLQRLQGLLNDARSKERTTAEKMVARTEHLEFYLRSTGPLKNGSGPPKFLRVPITIRMPTSHCRHVLGAAMSQLFKHAGLPTRFHWGPEYWESTCVTSATSPQRAIICHPHLYPPPKDLV